MSVEIKRGMGDYERAFIYESVLGSIAAGIPFRGISDPRDIAKHILGPKHVYVSTYCLHDQHSECRLTCKVCEAPCRCACHSLNDESPAEARPPSA